MSELRINIIDESWYCHLFSNTLCKAVANYLIGIEKFNQAFDSCIYAYKRDDTPLIQLPSMNIFPIKSSALGDYYYHEGTIGIEFNLPISINREETPLKAMTIAEAFILMIKAPLFIETLRETIPGLTRFGFDYDISYTNLYSEKNKDAFVIPMQCNYRIDIVQYYQYLEENGLDFSDPCNIIYDTLSSLKTNINLMPNSIQNN